MRLACCGWLSSRANGQAKVENLDDAVAGPHEILRLDVAVNHAFFVGVLESVSRLLDGAARLRNGQWATAGQMIGKVDAVDVLHDEEMETAD